MDPNELDPHKVFEGKGLHRMQRLRDARNKFRDEEWSVKEVKGQEVFDARVEIQFEDSREHPKGQYHPKILLSYERDWDECDQMRFASCEEAKNYAFHCLMVSLLERLVKGGKVWTGKS